VGGHSLFQCHAAPLGPRSSKGLVAKLGADFSHFPLVIESVHWWNGSANDFTQGFGCTPQIGCPYQFTLLCRHSSQPFQARRNQLSILDSLEDRKYLLVEIT